MDHTTLHQGCLWLALACFAGVHSHVSGRGRPRADGHGSATSLVSACFFTCWPTWLSRLYTTGCTLQPVVVYTRSHHGQHNRQ